MPLDIARMALRFAADGSHEGGIWPGMRQFLPIFRVLGQLGKGIGGFAPLRPGEVAFTEVWVR
jgi:hypothetical protein